MNLIVNIDFFYFLNLKCGTKYTVACRYADRYFVYSRLCKKIILGAFIGDNLLAINKINLLILSK